MIDFSNCKNSSEYYGGSSTNLGIIYNNDKYLLKIHDNVNPGEKQDATKESYYRNNIICEYICCNIIKNIFNFDVQEAILGKYCDPMNKKYRDVICCKDFKQRGESLKHFNDLLDRTLLKTLSQHETKISLSIDETLKQIKYINSNFGYDIMQFFWNMFFIDIFFGNYDRHGENWGVLENSINNSYRIAPLYDLGSTICGALDIKFLQDICKMTDNEFALYLYNCNFSAFNFQDSYNKLYYKTFLNKILYKLYPNYKNYMINAIKLIMSKIDLTKINSLIDNLYIESLYTSKEDILIRKEFTKRFLLTTYNIFMIPLYNKIINYDKLLPLKSKIMSQYKYNLGTKKLVEVDKNFDKYWDLRKLKLQSGLYYKKEG